MRKRAHLIPNAHCEQCGRDLWKLIDTPKRTIYGCADMHLLMIVRPSFRPMEHKEKYMIGLLFVVGAIVACVLLARWLA